MANLDTMSGQQLQSMTAQNTTASNAQPFGPSGEDYDTYMKKRMDDMMTNPAAFSPATAGGEAPAENTQEGA